MIEMIVTIVLLAIIATIGLVSLRNLAQDTGATADEVQQARAAALKSGSPVTALVARKGRMLRLTAFPDGSVAADTALRLDPLSGQVMHEVQ